MCVMCLRVCLCVPVCLCVCGRVSKQERLERGREKAEKHHDHQGRTSPPYSLSSLQPPSGTESALRLGKREGRTTIHCGPPLCRSGRREGEATDREHE